MNLIPNGAIVNDIGSLRLSLLPFDDVIQEQKRQNIIGPNGPLGAIVMICEVVPGYENPFWEINNNRIFNPVSNQTVVNATGNQIATINVTSSSISVTLTIHIPFDVEFPDELNGTYTCKASNGTISTSVLLTNSK